MSRPVLAPVLFAIVASWAAAPAAAVDGQVLITHAKALAGNVTAGDAAGYPVTLSVSGSFVLGGNLSPGPNLDAIDAATADISIDLNGFKISGGPAGGSNNARLGIWGKGDRLTVKNGTITGFELASIHAPSRLYVIVENMRLINNYRGLNSGPFARIQNSTVASNINIGINCGSSCHVEGNVVSNNGGAGIFLTTGTVLGNTIFNNGSYGIFANAPTTHFITGWGNNTLLDNNPSGLQTTGPLTDLEPNACTPAC